MRLPFSTDTSSAATNLRVQADTLPEAQLDRFLTQIDVNYPDIEAERRMLLATTGSQDVKVRPAMTAADLLAAQRLVRRVPVGEKVVTAILELVRSARPEEGASAEVERHVAWGPGPRASCRNI